jgi:hypothetical protein
VRNNIINTVNIAAASKGAPFMFTINVNADDIISLPTLLSDLTYDYYVDWGDGNISPRIQTHNDLNKQHTYTSSGEYQVKVYGIMEGFTVPSFVPIRNNIISIDSWGTAGMFKDFSISNSTSLISLPNQSGKLFNLTNIGPIFSGCSSLGNIPNGIFKGNTIATSANGAFQNCDSLTSIPEDLFLNTAITDFRLAFSGCVNISSIPENLFASNVNAVDFSSTFKEMTGITNIPSGLFSNNPNVTTFEETFLFCGGITSIPLTLFDSNTSVTSFRGTFNSCISLTGAAPALWLRTDPIPLGTNCFNNCPGLTNRNVIPSNWGGDLLVVTFNQITIGDGANNSEWVIWMDLQMDTNYIPATPAFNIPGFTITDVNYQYGDEYVVIITSELAQTGQSYTMSYTQPGVNDLRSIQGTLLDSFTDYSVTNNV